MARRQIVGIIGSRDCSAKVEQNAQILGKKLIKVVDTIVCGGLSGVMKAVCQGFKSVGGLTIGIIPSYNKNDANSYVDIVIPSGLGLARNVLVVKSADVVIALPGSAGTLSEIAYCLQLGVPVISLGSWNIKGVIKARTADEAIQKTKKILQTQQRKGA